MLHDCHSGSCSGHHSHSSAGGCGCNCGPGCKCDCHSGCNCGCHQGHQGSFADQLLHLADEAWMEVVKETIKDEIRKNSGDHIKKIAQLTSESNNIRWKEKLGKIQAEQDFESRLHELLHRK